MKPNCSLRFVVLRRRRVAKFIGRPSGSRKENDPPIGDAAGCLCWVENAPTTLGTTRPALPAKSDGGRARLDEIREANIVLSR